MGDVVRRRVEVVTLDGRSTALGVCHARKASRSPLRNRRNQRPRPSAALNPVLLFYCGRLAYSTLVQHLLRRGQHVFDRHAVLGAT